MLMNNKFLKRRFFIAFLLLIFLYSCGNGSNSGPSNVVDENSAPSITGSISSIRVGEELVFLPIASDVDGDNLTFSIIGAPDWTTSSTLNPLAINASAEINLCDANDISIKQFVELRRTALLQELKYNGHE